MRLKSLAAGKLPARSPVPQGARPRPPQRNLDPTSQPQCVYCVLDNASIKFPRVESPQPPQSNRLHNPPCLLSPPQRFNLLSTPIPPLPPFSQVLLFLVFSASNLP